MKITLKTPNGEIIEKTIKAERYTDNTVKSDLDSKENAITKILVAKKVGYIFVASMESGYLKDQTKVNNFINEIKDYPYLIIDIRCNGGGSDTYWRKNIVKPLLNRKLTYEPLLAFRDGGYIKAFLEEKLQYGEPIEPIKDLPKEIKYTSDINTGFKGFTKLKDEMNPLNSINFKGKIYLLVDDGDYSSSESFAAFGPIMLFKYLLLKVTYELSDEDVVERTLYDMPFKYFLNIAPEGTNLINLSTLTKFRKLRLKDMNLLDLLINKTVEREDCYGL